MMVKGKASETIKNDLQFARMCVQVCGVFIKLLARGYEIDVTTGMEDEAEMPQH